VYLRSVSVLIWYGRWGDGPVHEGLRVGEGLGEADDGDLLVEEPGQRLCVGQDDTRVDLPEHAARVSDDLKWIRGLTHAAPGRKR
jgi:hypothetical protein